MILMKAIELKYYLNAALVLGGLSLAFIVNTDARGARLSRAQK